VTPLTIGSTFTGIGGADLGFEWAGFRVAWQCEFDTWKQQVLRAHWPDVPLYDDITTLHDPPAVDVMLGGFPCQDLSVAGKRKGFDGQRSVLAFEFLRVAESLAPRWIVLENVPGLLSSNHGRDFARLVDEMVGCGYGVAWRILDARYFGVPQRRRRVFLVARRADAQLDTRASGRLALRALIESGSGDPTPGWPSRQDTPETWVDDGAANTLNRFDQGDTRTTHAVVDAASTLQSNHSGGVRMDAEGAAGGHLAVEPTTVRRLTPLECERLMGLPDGWTAPEGVKAPDSKRYAACGDAIVTWVAYWIGQRIRMIEEEA